MGSLLLLCTIATGRACLGRHLAASTGLDSGFGMFQPQAYFLSTARKRSTRPCLVTGSASVEFSAEFILHAITVSGSRPSSMYRGPSSLFLSPMPYDGIVHQTYIELRQSAGSCRSIPVSKGSRQKDCLNLCFTVAGRCYTHNDGPLKVEYEAPHGGSDKLYCRGALARQLSTCVTGSSPLDWIQPAMQSMNATKSALSWRQRCVP